jgi:hypothetical protein
MRWVLSRREYIAVDVRSRRRLVRIIHRLGTNRIHKCLKIDRLSYFKASEQDSTKLSDSGGQIGDATTNEVSKGCVSFRLYDMQRKPSCTCHFSPSSSVIPTTTFIEPSGVERRILHSLLTGIQTD